jgi:hypothetical protein
VTSAIANTKKAETGFFSILFTIQVAKNFNCATSTGPGNLKNLNRLVTALSFKLSALTAAGTDVRCPGVPAWITMSPASDLDRTNCSGNFLDARAELSRSVVASPQEALKNSSKSFLKGQ